MAMEHWSTVITAGIHTQYIHTNIHTYIQTHTQTDTHTPRERQREKKSERVTEGGGRGGWTRRDPREGVRCVE